MGPPLYDSSRLGSIISMCCSEEDKIYEVTQEEPELVTIWDEELSVTSSRDVEDITYQDPVEMDMIITFPYEVNEEEWLNHFSTMIEDGTTLDFASSFYMKMCHYDQKFEDLDGSPYLL